MLMLRCAGFSIGDDWPFGQKLERHIWMELRERSECSCLTRRSKSGNNRGWGEIVVVGMGGRAEHTKEENTAVQDIEKAVRMIQHVLKELSESE